MRISDLDKATICGFPVSTGDLDHNFAVIRDNVERGSGIWVVTLNLEMIYRTNTYDGYRSLLSNADLFIADGVPLIWASKAKKDTPKIDGRSNGTDLVERILRSNINCRLGIIGGTAPSSVVKELNPKLLEGAYFYDGTVDMNNLNLISQLIKDIQKKEIDLLFLGLGVPKQDQLAWEISQRINSITVVGVGGSFDLLAGRKPRAPEWMQRNGLEWFYRLLTEPKRLSKRYLLHYPRAVYHLVKDIF